MDPYFSFKTINQISALCFPQISWAADFIRHKKLNEKEDTDLGHCKKKVRGVYIL